MIATTLRSRVGTSNTISRLRHDRSTAVRDPEDSRKIHWSVLLPLVFCGWLVLHVKMLSMSFEPPSSFEREQIYNQHVTRPSKTNLSDKSELARFVNEYPSIPDGENWNRVLYTGSFGLGHRMSKLSAAVHLVVSSSALQRYIPRIEVQWGTCPSSENDASKAIDIFAYLFQTTDLVLPDIFPEHTRSDSEKDPRQNATGGKVLWIRNDVAGYYAGQAYKNAQIALNVTRAASIFTDKLQTDYALYEHLFRTKRFVGFHEVQAFQKQHRWEDFFVIGVHIRAGNGEQHHFASAQRNQFAPEQQTEALYRIAQSIRQLYRASMDRVRQKGRPRKAPLVFLATDTESYIPALHQELSDFCNVIVYHHQPRVPPGQGVSYETNWTHADPRTCLKGWYGAAMDMMLLSSSDVVVATSRSTFTQIVPASMVFHRTTDHVWKYCEMDLFTSSSAAKMTCFSDQTSWLFRQNENTWHTFCIPGNDTYSNQNHPVCDDKAGSILPVAQKLMIHLPDISISKENDRMYQATIDFLQSSDPLLPNETLFYYGKKYNPKYRHSLKHETYLTNWTWQ